MIINYNEKYAHPIIGTLILTDDCNLACQYCFVKKNSHYISLEMAKNIVKYLINNFYWYKTYYKNPIANQITVKFFGGEPLLCYDSIIKPLVEWCEIEYPNLVIFQITTNGILLTEDKLQFFQKHNFYLVLSMDGNKNTQNFNRPLKNENSNQTSFDILFKKLKLILEYFPNASIRMTVYSLTAKNLFKDYYFFQSLGFKNITIMPDVLHPWTKRQIYDINKQLTHIFFIRLKKYIFNNNNNFEYINGDERFINNYLYQKNIQFFNVSTERCGLGTVNGCLFNYNGDIFTCEQELNYNQSNLCNIGNIETGININKHKQILQFYLNKQVNNIKLKKCEKCKLKNFCSAENLCLFCFNSNCQFNIPFFYCLYYKHLYKLFIIKFYIDKILKKEG